MQPVRTNNDVEGYHRRLNAAATRGSLPFYVLIELLGREAAMVELQAKLVSEDKLKRHQRKKYAHLQGRMFKYWNEYVEGSRSTSSLLRACSRLYGPTN